MRKLINKVRLVLFEDDGNGEYGLTHQETYDDPMGYNFNAFWTGVGIFHDVFEHWHEYRHKYFQGYYAMNVGGEMTAMGAMWYYVDKLGVEDARSLSYRSVTNWGKAFINGTIGEIQEAICSGYPRYGNTLESCIPKQRPVSNNAIEYQLDEYVSKVREFEYSYILNERYVNQQEKEDSKTYKESVTPRKIRDLHRWGYRKAERMIPYDYRNRDTLIDFIEFFDEFCKNNNAKELYDIGYRGMIVNVYKEKGLVSWTAKLIGDHNKRITNTENIFDYEPFN